MLILALDCCIFNPANHIMHPVASCCRLSFRVDAWVGGGVDKIPNPQGDVTIVTGANAVIEKETCKVHIVSSRRQPILLVLDPGD